MVDSGNSVGFCSSDKTIWVNGLVLEYSTPETWCPAGISGLFRPLAQPTPTSPLPCLTTNPIHPCVSPHLVSGWSSDRVDHAGKSARGITVPLGAMNVVVATLG